MISENITDQFEFDVSYSKAKPIRLLFCAYRPWALEIFKNIQNKIKNLKTRHGSTLKLVTTPNSLLQEAQESEWDIIVLVGWSWKVPSSVLNNNYVIGMHPSDLPAYAGGSPIQNQILDGVKNTNASIFKLTPNFDEGPIISKHEISLEGHLSQVFSSIGYATYEMLVDIIKRWPNKLPEVSQDKTKGFVKKRIQPQNSELKKKAIPKMTCEKLWDVIRCREDPYPNVWLEDKTGRLIIKHVEFEPKKKK